MNYQKYPIIEIIHLLLKCADFNQKKFNKNEKY